jgi:hypothetical protein
MPTLLILDDYNFRGRGGQYPAENNTLKMLERKILTKLKKRFMIFTMVLIESTDGNMFKRIYKGNASDQGRKSPESDCSENKE